MTRQENTYTYNGKTLPTSGWVDELCISLPAFNQRVAKIKQENNGEIDQHSVGYYKLFAKQKGLYTYKGEKVTMKELAHLSGIPIGTLRSRLLMQHWDINRATTQAVQTKGVPTNLPPAVLHRIPNDILIKEIKRRKAEGLL